jgi:HAD superfamily hydrolase (TIGR01509 family)
MDLKLLESVMRAFCPQTSKGHFNVPEGYNFRGAVFDLDGVVTQTSHLHEEAWKQLFDEFLNKKKNESQARGDDPADTKQETKKKKKKKEDEGHEDAEEGVGGKLCEGGKEKAESSSDNGRHVQDSEAKAENSVDKEGKPKRDGEGKEEETVPNGDPYRPFTEQDYLTYVDGRPRIDGITTFLKSRGIELQQGDAKDDEDMETVNGLGNRKNRFFNALLKEKGVVVYKATVELIKELKRMGVKIGVASSSKNCRAVLAIAEIESLFSVVIDGVVSESLGLKGKPAPDIFTKCAEMLGVHPRESIMVEDATSGVQAGKAGDFGLVIGIDRAKGRNRQPLLSAGADVVLDDFSQITSWHLNDFFLPNDAGYVLQFDNYEPKQERLREALCTLGNGYFATRGCLDEARADADEHYPGTYMARGWNREISKVEGRDVANEDLVNLPNWIHITFRPDGKDWFSWTRDTKGNLPFELLHYDTRLDTHNGLLVRRYRVKDDEGRITMIMTHRVVHMKKPHLGLIKYTLVPENWGGKIDIASELDGSVRNTGVPRYLGLHDKHLRVLEKGKFPLSTNADEKDQGVYILTRFTKTSCEVAMAARTRVYRGTSSNPLDNPVIGRRPTQARSCSANGTEIKLTQQLIPPPQRCSGGRRKDDADLFR